MPRSATASGSAAFRWKSASPARRPHRRLARTPARCCARSSVGILGFQQRQWRFRQDHEVEHERPVLDVIEIVLDALLDLLGRSEFAAPAIDLRPSGDAGLDAVAGEIAVDRLVELPGLCLLCSPLRARAPPLPVALLHP